MPPQLAQEEIGVTPLEIEERGELHFQFTDGYSLHCTVFLARDFHGELIETDEATPHWFDLGAIPYEEMWEDDRHWLPEVLAGKSFRAWFEFDGNDGIDRVEMTRVNGAVHVRHSEATTDDIEEGRAAR